MMLLTCRLSVLSVYCYTIHTYGCSFQVAKRCSEPGTV